MRWDVGQFDSNLSPNHISNSAALYTLIAPSSNII
jgi:hypothetical protein